MTPTKAAGSAVISRKITFNQKAKQVNEISKIYGKKTLHLFQKQLFVGVLQNSRKACNFIKKRPQNMFFQVNIPKLLRTEHL